MATVTFSAPVDSRALIAEIDALTEADVTSVSLDPVTGLETRTFDLLDGRVLSVESRSGEAGYFSVSDGGEEIFVVEYLPPGVDLAGGYALGDALAGDSVAFFGSDAGAVMEGYGHNDVFLGSAGTFIGGGGDDVLWLLSDAVTGEDVPGPVIGFGGAGNDRLVIAGVTEALAVGGGGDDTLGLISGAGAVSGGSGADTLVFEGGRGFASGGAGADTFRFAAGAEPEPLAVRILDFNPSEDGLAFVFDEGVLPEGATTLADLAGPGTLADLGAVTFDGVSYAVGETAGGDTWIARQGTSTAGTVYDDRILLDGVAADEVALSAIALEDGILG